MGKMTTIIELKPTFEEGTLALSGGVNANAWSTDRAGHTTFLVAGHTENGNF